MIAGLKDLVILKSSEGRSSPDIPVRQYTTLAEATEEFWRLSVTAGWRYTAEFMIFTGFDGVRATLLEVFAAHYSYSLQNSLFEGLNRVTANNDPTAHAEVTAIRAACARLGTFDLTGAAVYSSCEPCPMCLASALWARVATVYFAADRHDAAAAGFDDAVFYDFFDAPVAERSMAVAQLAIGGAHLAPFDAWALWNQGLSIEESRWRAWTRSRGTVRIA